MNENFKNCGCVSCRARAKIDSILERAKASGGYPTDQDFEESEKEIRKLRDVVCFKLSLLHGARVMIVKLSRSMLN